MGKRKARRARFEAEGRVLLVVNRSPRGAQAGSAWQRRFHDQAHSITCRRSLLCQAIDKLDCPISKMGHAKFEEWWIIEDDLRAAKVVAEVCLEEKKIWRSRSKEIVFNTVAAEDYHPRFFKEDK